MGSWRLHRERCTDEDVAYCESMFSRKGNRHRRLNVQRVQEYNNVLIYPQQIQNYIFQILRSQHLRHNTELHLYATKTINDKRRRKGFFMKLFRTNNIETVKSCQYYFNFKPPSLLWSERVKKFDNKYDLFTGSLFTV